jgi:hypothetical protein
VRLLLQLLLLLLVVVVGPAIQVLAAGPLIPLTSTHLRLPTTSRLLLLQLLVVLLQGTDTADRRLLQRQLTQHVQMLGWGHVQRGAQPLAGW